ncbi:MAG: phosphate signaling complex protein PhoU, partial [Deltaproteobacteria bacterium]|nr:phosphate signaling complex protein PhoU [Deltaproteobacteria bacterium]
MDQRHFDVELHELKEKLLLMAGKVEFLINRSIEAVSNKDAALAETIFGLDKEIDHLELEVEEAAVSLIARHQPAAGDLRFLIGAIKINNDLERIGDHGVNIAQSAKALAGQPDVKPLVDIPRMAGLAVGMLKDSLTSFVTSDPVKAREVCTRDDQVDFLKRQVLRDLLALMKDDPGIVSRGMDLVFISRNLERVADLATNISEETIY